MDRGAWWASVHGITGSDMTEQLSVPAHTNNKIYHKFFFLKSQTTVLQINHKACESTCPPLCTGCTFHTHTPASYVDKQH